MRVTDNRALYYLSVKVDAVDFDIHIIMKRNWKIKHQKGRQRLINP